MATPAKTSDTVFFMVLTTTFNLGGSRAVAVRGIFDDYNKAKKTESQLRRDFKDDPVTKVHTVRLRDFHFDLDHPETLVILSKDENGNVLGTNGKIKTKAPKK